MLLVDVHELNVIFAHPRRGAGLEDQVDDIRRVLSLDGQLVLVSSRTKHFCKGSEVDSKCDIAVATKRVEGFGFEHHGDKGDVGVVHGLERDTRVIAVEVAVLHEVLDGIDDLDVVRTAFTTLSCANAPFSEHWLEVVLPRALWNVSFVHSVHWARCTFGCELR